MAWRKYRKVQNFSSSNKKRNKKNDKNGTEDITTVSYKIISCKIYGKLIIKSYR